MKAATYTALLCQVVFGFQSTPPVKAATPCPRVKLPKLLISIHAAREGGDFLPFLHFLYCQISIHAAREGGDWYAVREYEHSGRISIHAAREGGDTLRVPLFTTLNISIHAAREGGDIAELWFMPSTSRFQSTPPVKAATPRLRRRGRHSDHFNPRRP